MSLLSDGRSLLEIVGRCSAWIRDRRDPFRSQAQRFLRAFEAHGIAALRIPRILPEKFRLSPSALIEASQLKHELTPSILDWACDYLKLSRPWLDGESNLPHLYVNGYKKESRHAAWLEERIGAFPDVDRWLHLLVEFDPGQHAVSYGPVCLVYSEESDWLDGETLRRYWMFSFGYRMDHGNCIKSMLRSAQIAEDLGVYAIGRRVPVGTLRKLEDGKILIPQAASQFGELWYPDELNYR